MKVDFLGNEALSKKKNIIPCFRLIFSREISPYPVKPPVAVHPERERERKREREREKGDKRILKIRLGKIYKSFHNDIQLTR